ncbi:MAG: MraY family glycosyltransferase [Patescibacteria group bacterium]|nr:MraY family glycosyltransferase [Patescibacteria group bacterium]
MSSGKLLIYAFSFIFPLTLAIFLTPKVRKMAIKFGILDVPNDARKIQKEPVPLLGGVAVFGAFLAGLLIAWLAGWLNDGVLKNLQIAGLLIGGCLLMIGGWLDDKYKLKPWQSFLFPVAATIVVVIFGVAVKYITNPFVAGTGPFGRALFYFNWLDLKVISFGALFSFFWILGMIYTTKFLDGLDGLVSGIGAIGAIILFIVSLFWDVPMSGTSVLCLLLAGALLGFLKFNFHPAKIFLGEGGATFVGFMLGCLSIISGGKIATALLIMGLPILDVVLVILRRVFSGRHVYEGDRGHLHFRLLDAGLTQRQAVLILYFLALVFGLSSLFLQSSGKVVALVILLAVMILVVGGVVLMGRKKSENRN